MHQQLRRRVIELIGVHRLEEGDLVGHAGKVRQAVGDPRPRLPVLLEGGLRTEHPRDPLDERKALAFEQ